MAVVHLAESLHHIGLGPVEDDREPALVQIYGIYVALPSWLEAVQMGIRLMTKYCGSMKCLG